MKIKVVTMHICQACLDGIGAECHTPECVMWLHRIDLPFDPRTYEVQREYDTQPERKFTGPGHLEQTGYIDGPALPNGDRGSAA